MDRIVSRFINAALIYFALGMALGVVLIFWPKWPSVMRSVHTHINLMGWLPMLVYAAGYSIMPRFVGRPIYSRRLATLQFWMSNGSLISMNVFWVLSAIQEPGTLAFVFIYSLLAFSSILMFISALLFVLNMMMTMNKR